MRPQKGKRFFIYDDKLIQECDRIPVIKTRASRVQDLIASYDLLDYFTVKPSVLASRDDLLLCHSGDYLDTVADPKSSEETEEEYGLNYDCPRIPKLFEFFQRIAGGTISAAQALIEGGSVAINWCGGWHHAQRDKAEGFCYVNDIVIGIQRLSSCFERILYIDMDVHHGDGVENAFSNTRRVFTLSFNQFETGFYPGTGGELQAGFGAAAKGYAVNFPFKRHLNGRKYVKFFRKTSNLIIESYKPQVIVLQCGADILSGDPLGGANVSTMDMGECLKEVLKHQLPLMVLGGGGYNLSNTARYWTYLTSILCDQELDEDLPDNSFFLDYGPTYELHVPRSNAMDENKEEDLEEQFQEIQKNCQRLNEH